MTDISQPIETAVEPMRTTTSLMTETTRTKRRNAAERRFQWYGIIAISIALATLAFMLFTIFKDGSSAFVQAKITYPVTIDAAVVDKSGNRDSPRCRRLRPSATGVC
jgi:phosphate transport system permease protein